MEKNIYKYTVHPYHNKKPCPPGEEFFNIDQPVTEAKGKYGPASAGKYK